MPKLGSIAMSKISFFDREFLLRRHDHGVDVAGGFAAAQLVSPHTEDQGQHLPTKRHPYNRDADDRPTRDRLMVSIDFSNIRYN